MRGGGPAIVVAVKGRDDEETPAWTKVPGWLRHCWDWTASES